MEVFIIRHTRLSVDPGICYGQSDVRVAKSFREEAQAYKDSLNMDFDAVYASPLQRTIQLATEFSQTVQKDDRLLEMNFGDWEMKGWNSIREEELNSWMENFVDEPATNGECLRQVSMRVSDFFDELAQKSFQRVLIVTHAGVIRSAWHYVLGVPLENVFRIPVSYGGLLCFQFISGKPQLLSWRK